MSNINKILITVAVCVFMVCTASVSIVKIVTDNKATTSVSESGTEGQAGEATGQSDAAVTASTLPTQTTAPTGSYTSGSNSSQTTASYTENSSTASTTAFAQNGDLSQALLGKWTDSAGMSGYEFLPGGSVNMTYVNLAQFNIPFDGTAKGMYTLEGDTLTVKFSIYAATIKNTYKISIDGNTLSMFNIEEYATSTYTRVS